MKDKGVGWAVKIDDVSVVYRTGNLLKGRFEHKAIDNVSFRIKKGETFGVIGRNGCGKSSLLKVLAGIVKPTHGAVQYRGIQSKALLSLGLGFDNQLSGTDNAILSLMIQGYSRNQALKLLPGIIDFSELGKFIDQPVKTYSSGMRSRLGFSVSVVSETDFLLIDETLSVGDISFRKKAEKLMLERINGNQTVVLVSHNGSQIESLCHRAIWLENGVIQEKGNPKKVISKYNRYMREVSAKATSGTEEANKL